MAEERGREYTYKKHYELQTHPLSLWFYRFFFHSVECYNLNIKIDIQER